MNKYKNSFQVKFFNENGGISNIIKFNYDNDEVCRNANNKLNNIDIASRFCLLNFDRMCVVKSISSTFFIIVNSMTSENIGNPFVVVEDWEYIKIKENDLMNK